MSLGPLYLRLETYEDLDEVDEGADASENVLPKLDETVPNLEEFSMSYAAAALAQADRDGSGHLWDLYDTGASHHMSPCHEDFITFQATQPYTLSAANQQPFLAHGFGDMEIRVPVNGTYSKITLTHVLYTPTVGFNLVSIGRIDDAGYISIFAYGRGEIWTQDDILVGVIPKTNGVYKVKHVPLKSVRNG